MPEAPGTEESAFLAFTLLDDLLKMLRERGVLSPDDVTCLLETATNRLSKQPRAVAQRSAGFIRNTMLPEYQIK